MEEIWKDIEGYRGIYQVSNLGRVKSLNYRHTGKEKILKPGTDRGGYLYVILYRDWERKTFKIHRLVAIHFIPNPNNLPEVNHIDEDKSNNCVTNLEWCNRGYNTNHGTRNQRIAEKNTNGKKSIPVVQIDPTTNEVINVYPSAMEAERQDGFDHGDITKCCKGKLKTHKGYKWMKLSDYIANMNPNIKVINLFGKQYDVNQEVSI